MGFHIAGDTDVVIGGIGDDEGGFVRPPTGDEIVSADTIELVGEVIADFDIAERTDAEIGEPGVESIGFDIVFAGEICGVGIAIGGDGIGRGVQIAGGGGEDPFATRTEVADDFIDIAEGKIGTTGGDEAGVVPDDEIVVAAITGIRGDEREDDGVSVVWVGEFELEFLIGDEGVDGFHPAFGAVEFSDVADAAETEEGLLPLGDIGSEHGDILGFGGLPACADAIENERGGSLVESIPEYAEVLGGEIVLLGDGIDRFGAGGEGIAFGDGGEEVLIDGESAPFVGVEHYSLKIDFVTAARVGVATVEVADLGERFVGPVAGGGCFGEAEAIGKEGGVRGDFLSGVEVLGEERGGHDEGVSGIGEAFAGGAIDGELAGGIEIDTGEIADGVGVFGVAESAEDDGTGISCIGVGFGGEVLVDPFADFAFLFGGQGFGVLGGHFLMVDQFGGFLPDLGGLADFVDGGEAVEYEISLGIVGGVTLEAGLLENGEGRLLVSGGGGAEHLICIGDCGSKRGNGERAREKTYR